MNKSYTEDFKRESVHYALGHPEKSRLGSVWSSARLVIRAHSNPYHDNLGLNIYF